MARARACRLALVVLVVGLLGTLSGGGGAAARALAGASTLEMPAAERFAYESGATITVVPMRELPLVSLVVFADGGSRDDPADRVGLASFVAELMDKGAGGMTRTELSTAVERLGAGLVVQATRDAISVNMDALAKDLDAALDLLLAVVLAPDFPDEEVERARERTLGRLVARLESERAVVAEHFDRLLFGDHPYGWPALGTPESVRGFTREDGVAFHAREMDPSRLRILVVGDVEPAAARRSVEAAVGRRGARLGSGRQLAAAPPAGGAPAGELAAATGRRIVLVHKPEVVQPQIWMGGPAPNVAHPDYDDLRTALIPFGATFTSWLIDRLRVDLGLTYSARSRLPQRRDPSSFYIETFTKSETVGRILTETFALIDRLHREGLSEEELAKARQIMRTGVIQRLESTGAIAEMLFQIELFGLGDDYLDRLSASLEAIDAARSREIIERYIPRSDQLLIVVCGDRNAIGTQLAEFGPVEVIDYRTGTPLD